MEVLATVTLASDTGLVKDSVVNNFAINSMANDDLLGEQTAVMDALIAFYNATPPGVDRIGSSFNSGLSAFLSPVLSTTANACEVALYDISDHLDGSPHGSPFIQKAFTLDSDPGGTALPSEVACVLTLEAVGRDTAPVNVPGGPAGPVGDTHPKARLTGRIYLGPLGANAITVTASVARPSNVLQDMLLAAAIQLDAAVRLTTPAADLGVWSRTNQEIVPVAFVSVDNAFDTQRRRGDSATARRRLPVAEA